MPRRNPPILVNQIDDMDNANENNQDRPAFRYDATLANEIESRWQRHWAESNYFHTPNPGDAGFDRISSRPKKYILDMFPYPSGVGLHVGHPLGYIATDVYARYLRAKGYNVLHTMGFDAFGLPAEQYAVETGTHPRITTEKNIATMRAQLARLGLGHDPVRSVSTTDVAFYRWTQWIFLQIYDSWYDPDAIGPMGKGRARPITQLIAEFKAGIRKPVHSEVNPEGAKGWSDLSEHERRTVVDSHRLAYLAEVPVNWCPALGTVLANEEVTADGRSERGNHPVYRRPLRQWMMRITAYGDRLLTDLEPLAWPESIKLMQRNWIGRSEGAWIDFPVSMNDGAFGRWRKERGTAGFPGGRPREDDVVRVFTTRADTVFGCTYMVLAPEHPLVDRIVGQAWPEGTPDEWKGDSKSAGSPALAVAAYRALVNSKSEVDRQSDTREKTGVFTGAYAVNPATGKQIPVFVADYVLMGYGTGAIMAVPAHDERDFEFAARFKLPIADVVHTPLLAAVSAVCGFAAAQHVPLASLNDLIVDFVAIAMGQQRTDYAVIWATVQDRRGDSASDPARLEPIDASMAQPLSEAAKGRRAEQRGAIRSIWADTLAPLLREPVEDLLAAAREHRLSARFGHATTDEGVAVNSKAADRSFDSLPTPEAKRAVTKWLEQHGLGKQAVTYKLRDWLFSRQRYWGEPFPIVYGEDGLPIALPESALPVTLPDLTNFSPKASDDPSATPEPPLGRATQWVSVEIDGKTYRRETNTMPQWAGSCWYYLRYLDPTNSAALVGSDVEQYWMLSTKDGSPVKPNESFDPTRHHIGGVDLYVGGVEHAVLHLLYARFWHKILFDLGHVSTPEPFGRLFSQGYIQAWSYIDSRGVYVPAEEVEERAGKFFYKGSEVSRSYGKMGKSLKNAVAPDDICAAYGCDTLRLYEMSMGPLDMSKPWNPRDIVGSQRFLQRVWRNLVDEASGACRATDTTADDSLQRLTHRTIARVDSAMKSLSFNVAIAALIEFNNELVGLQSLPRSVGETFVRMLAPFAPHIAEELWKRLGHAGGLLYEPFPVADPRLVAHEQMEIVVQVSGKVRGKVLAPPKADEATVMKCVLADEKVSSHLTGKSVRKVIFVPDRLINIVAG